MKCSEVEAALAAYREKFGDVEVVAEWDSGEWVVVTELYIEAAVDGVTIALLDTGDNIAHGRRSVERAFTVDAREMQMGGDATYHDTLLRAMETALQTGRMQLVHVVPEGSSEALQRGGRARAAGDGPRRDVFEHSATDPLYDDEAPEDGVGVLDDARKAAKATGRAQLVLVTPDGEGEWLKPELVGRRDDAGR